MGHFTRLARLEGVPDATQQQLDSIGYQPLNTVASKTNYCSHFLFTVLFLAFGAGGGYLVSPGLHSMNYFILGMTCFSLDLGLIIYALKNYKKEIGDNTSERLKLYGINGSDWSSNWPHHMVVYRGFYIEPNQDTNEVLNKIFKDGMNPNGTMYFADEREGTKKGHVDELVIDVNTGRHNGLVSTTCSLPCALKYAFNSSLKTIKVDDPNNNQPKGWIFLIKVVPNDAFKVINISSRIPYQNEKEAEHSEQEIAFTKVPGSLILGALPVIWERSGMCNQYKIDHHNFKSNPNFYLGRPPDFDEITKLGVDSQTVQIIHKKNVSIKACGSREPFEKSYFWEAIEKAGRYAKFTKV